MKHIIFATGNARKVAEANKTLATYAVSVAPVKLDLDEIQHEDPVEITKAKARTAYALTNEPVVVSDTSWEVPSLGGFPGGYMKDVSAWLAPGDWLALMVRYSNRTIICHEHLAYFDGVTMKHFVASYEGVFVDEPRGKSDTDSIEQVVTLYGGLTLAEYLERGEVASAGEVLEHWVEFANWYNSELV